MSGHPLEFRPGAHGTATQKSDGPAGDVDPGEWREARHRKVGRAPTGGEVLEAGRDRQSLQGNPYVPPS